MSATRKTSLPANLPIGATIQFRGASMIETATVTAIGDVVHWGENPRQIVEAVRVTTSVPSLVGTAVTLYLPARTRVRIA